MKNPCRQFIALIQKVGPTGLLAGVLLLGGFCGAQRAGRTPYARGTDG